ncbi:glycoside hydrolase family 88/105 protein [Fibrella forsythiae]|uniref:Glycoside hydrolase family 88 protein n=1 Tax=Fibrella forsythiae TaxID=2817061 RepID=A0ABS3JD14_9BACT|nr:glycoside hydrolase family 88 protein [Fibrella forsythiae]MBO0947885.1 glycoside hydrolase family 88 protein [Fibrella forsythiae]
MKNVLLALALLPCWVQAQTLPWSQRMTATIMATYPDSMVAKGGRMAHWDYEMGLMMHAVEAVWTRTGNARYYNYMLKSMDQMVNEDGSIKNYEASKFNIDFIAPGRSLLLLSQLSLPRKEKYRKAADLLRRQLANQPRTKEGGFWHKQTYPNQMWLDGLYMAEPFYAEYTQLYDPTGKGFDDIINQFVWMEKHARDEKTGLLYHAWDESREQKWANPKTGTSPNFWSRSLGWYGMALADVLDYIPASHPRRGELLAILQRFMPAVLKFQDPVSGCWYQVTDRLGDKGNYLEASGTSMFVYTLAKGVRMGYLPASMMAAARKGYDGMLKNFTSTDAKGLVHLEKTVSVGGLGGNPYRDGSYDYYLSEKLRQDDLKGVGPFVLASLEMEAANERASLKPRTVAVDTYFNHEFRKGADGQQEPYHYTWEDRQHSGFWLWGNTFRDLGAKTVSVSGAPTAASLKHVDIYIIVDPDTPKETAKPNYISAADSKAIADWVKAGGVLVLMANDTSNCEHVHLNQLAAQFGMQFLPKNINMVKGDQFEQGRVDIPAGSAIFPNTKSAYIKELAPINAKAPAKAVVSKAGDVIIATAKIGKGTVFAVGDPWLYTEYVDGRKIPATFENFNAGKDLAIWLLKQTR